MILNMMTMIIIVVWNYCMIVFHHGVLYLNDCMKMVHLHGVIEPTVPTSKWEVNEVTWI